MSAERPVDPYQGYRFKVEVESVIVAGFAEVTGLRREIRTQEYEEGGVNHFTHVLPTRATQSTLTLRRGLTDSTELWAWLQDAVDGLARRRLVRIVLLDDGGEESWGWELRGAFPVSWSGPDLQATQGTVAMEELELAHHGLSRMEGLPSG